MRSFNSVDELQKAVLATGIAVLFFLFTNGQKGLEFNNHVIHSGVPGENHCVYRFISVSKGIDALVKIKKRSAENILLENIDVNYTGYTHAFQPRIGPAGGSVNDKSEWWMDFEIRFVRSGTLSTAHLKSFYATALDIDGDGGSVTEYIEMFKAESYAIEKPSLLTVFNLPETGAGTQENEDDDKGRGKRFVATSKSFEGIDTLATQVMATMQFKHTHKITIRIGASKNQNGNSTAAYRYNSIWFKSFEYETATFLPLTLTSFAVTYKNNKAVLQWSTLAETNFSHFVIERSRNGVEFSDAGVLFTEDNITIAKNYVYTDVVLNAPIIYYRLRMVDLDGKFNLSPVRLIRTGVAGKEALIAVFPNPVTNELRITIPEKWQGSAVVYQVSRYDGRIVRRWNVTNASQTEVTDFSQLPAGSYLITVQRDAEILTQKIIRK